jgi:glycosyltransferase involved in cell wall biosynthesis
MNSTCQVSVVMSVYNDEATLPQAVQSILGQKEVDLEYIIVIDGSRDGSREIAEEFARTDTRVKLLVRENRGLTQSLIEACELARGEFIARQDADDVSLPGRLRKQLQILQSHPEAVLVGCGTRFVTPEGHELYSTFPDVRRAVAQVKACELAGLNIMSSHGSAMFRASAYKSVGGYRKEFYFGQDVDLWVRIFDVGEFRSVDEILYVMRLSAKGISSMWRPEQIALARLSFDAARLRRKGLTEEPILAAAAQIRATEQTKSTIVRSRIREARGLYFFGSCLLRADTETAGEYYLRSLKLWPFQIKAWYGLMRSCGLL